MHALKAFLRQHEEAQRNIDIEAMRRINMDMRGGEIHISHDSWRWYLLSQGYAVKQSWHHLIALCDGVLGEVLPSWVLGSWEGDTRGLCVYLCTHEAVLPKGTFTNNKINSLCFPIAYTQAKSKGSNIKHEYMFHGMGKKGVVNHSYIRVLLGEGALGRGGAFGHEHLLLCSQALNGLLYLCPLPC